MTLVTSILQKGTNNHLTSSEEANKFTTNFVTPGIVGVAVNTSGVAPSTGAFAVNAAATPNKTVLISTGDAYVTATPSGQGSQTLNVTNNAIITITIADNVTGSTRYDWIYLKIDPTAANNPAVDASDAASIVVNRSTSNASDTVGAPAYNQLLAIVTVNNAFSTITNGNITDRRVSASAAIVDGSITTAKLADGGVTAQKLSTAAIKLALAKQSAPLTITNAGPTQVTGMSITFTNPNGGREVLIKAHFPQLSLGGQYVATVAIWDGAVGTGTKVQEAGFTTVSGGVNSFTIEYIPPTLSAGASKTYNVSISTNGNASSFTAQQSATIQAFLIATAI